MTWQQGLLGASLIGLGILVGAQFRAPAPPPEKPLFALEASFGPSLGISVKANLPKIQQPAAKPEEPAFTADVRSRCQLAMVGNGSKLGTEACVSAIARQKAAQVRDRFKGRDLASLEDTETLLAYYLGERERIRNGPSASEGTDPDALGSMGRAAEALDRILSLNPNHEVALRFRMEQDLMVEFLACGAEPKANCDSARKQVDETLSRLGKLAAREPISLVFGAEWALYRGNFAHLKSFEALLRSVGEPAAANYFAAWALHLQGKSKEAAVLLRKGFKSLKSESPFWALPFEQLAQELEKGNRVSQFQPFSVPLSQGVR